MASYMYISSPGTDPGDGVLLTDPLFGPVPTLGACVPNIRAFVEPGDWIFVISGRRRNLQQYMIGGLRVAEKIDALAAYNRLPEYRMQRNEEGLVVGNIPVGETGQKHELDSHRAERFEERIKNYIIGDNAIHISTRPEVELAREQTLPMIAQIKQKPGNRVIDVMGRHAKLANEEAEKLLDWLNGIKQTANG